MIRLTPRLTESAQISDFLRADFRFSVEFLTRAVVFLVLSAAGFFYRYCRCYYQSWLLVAFYILLRALLQA